DPLTPGAGVEPRTGESGMFEREQVMTCRDTRTAHGDGGRRRARAQHRGESLAQDVGGQEPSVGAKVVEKGTIPRAGDVAGNRVESFVAARESLGAARINEQISRPLPQFVDG